jgi:hypothetical protein
VHLNNPSDAEDCWQNTFLALFENQKVLRRGPEAVKRWLIRWDALNTVDETALLAAAEKVHYEQTPHSVSDDPDYPNYGTFTISGYVLFEDSVEEELRRELDVQIEFYADHFTHGGDGTTIPYTRSSVRTTPARAAANTSTPISTWTARRRALHRGHLLQDAGPAGLLRRPGGSGDHQSHGARKRDPLRGVPGVSGQGQKKMTRF